MILKVKKLVIKLPVKEAIFLLFHSKELIDWIIQAIN